jgi:glycine cleavage system H protein
MSKVNQYEIREHLYYDPVNHFWVDARRPFAVIGMTPLIQETSGSFVAVQVSPPGTALKRNQQMGMVEAEKHVGPLKSPVSGTVRLVNESVLSNPRLMNDEPYDGGWLMEIEMSDLTELDSMITGQENIRQWFEAELKRFNDKGWIAQP